MVDRTTKTFLFVIAIGLWANVASNWTVVSAQEPVTPTRLIDQAETRIVLVDILADSTRSMHGHNDMLWQVFVTMEAPMVLTIEGEAPVRLAPWQSHFMEGGTMHAITNPSLEPVQFLEFFSKKPGTVANVDEARKLALTLAERYPSVTTSAERSARTTATP